jgi:lipopolysaccharide transport system permease protein
VIEMATNSLDDKKNITIIRPYSGWFNIDFKELYRYRDLISLFVKRDFVAIYKQTILGPLWFLLQPLFTTIVFTIVFGRIARMPTDGLPQVLFYMSGTVVWSYFASCLTKTSDTFISNAAIFGKVYFPRLVVPISVVVTNLFTFAIQFGLFLVFMVFFYLQGSDINPNFWILLTPLLLVQLASLGLGTGILVSSLTTKYRDLSMLVVFGVQLWMYATPVVYPLSEIPAKWQWLYALNPMAVVIELFRYAFLGSGSVKLWQVAMSVGMTVFILFAGVVMFNRIEKTFMDTV